MGALGLKNGQHEQLAVLIGTGQNHLDAYCVVYDCDRKSAHNRAKSVTERPEVARRIRQVQEAAEKKAIEFTVLARTEILDRYLRIMDHGMEIVPVLDRSGNPIGERMRDARAALDASKAYGIEIGMGVRETRVTRKDDNPLAGKTYKELVGITEKVNETLATHLQRSRDREARATGDDGDPEGAGAVEAARVPDGSDPRALQ